MVDEESELDEAFYKKHRHLHEDWAEKILDFKIGINPPNDWIEKHFEAASNDAPNNICLLWDMVTNMEAWAKTDDACHQDIVQCFGSAIKRSLGYYDKDKTEEELRKTFLECEGEIMLKAKKMSDAYIEEARAKTEHDDYG